MKFKRISTTNFFEQESASASLVNVFLYSKSEVNNEIIFDNSYVLKSKKWIICFVKGNGQVSEINTITLDKVFLGNPYTGYFLWLDSYKSFEFQDDYYQRRKYIALVGDNISDYQLYTQPKPGITLKHRLKFVGLDEQNISINDKEISFSKTESIKFSINSSETILNRLVLDIEVASESKGSFKLSSQFNRPKSSFINGKMGFISEKRLTANKESLLTFDLFDKDDLDKAHFSGTYYPFEEVYDSINKKYLSNFKISKPNLKTNFIDGLGRQYYADLDNSDLSFCFSRVVDNSLDINGKPKSENPQWDKYILRPLGKLKLKTIANSNILLGLSGTETFKNAGNELEVIFEDSVNIVVDEKNISLKKHNEKTRTSLLKLSSLNYNLDSEKTPNFKNTVDGNGSSNYEPLFFSNATEKALPIIPTLSFKDNPDLFELEEVFKKIRLKAHKDVKKKQEVLDLKEGKKFFEADEERITPHGFLRTKNGYEFIKSNGEFSLNGVINSDIDLSLRKDKVFFVLTPELLNNYNKIPNIKTVTLNANFKIHKNLDFKIDLNLYREQFTDNKHSKTIIIVASHDKPFIELIKDPKLWSNEGLIKFDDDHDLPHILKALDNCKNIANSDDYFNNDIYSKNNWKGVLILNIPITKPESIPDVFAGLGASQNLFGETPKGGLDLETAFKFEYLAFPTNQTSVVSGKFDVGKTSFYGAIDYNPFKNKEDYVTIATHLKEGDDFRFVLSKLKINFTNSSIHKFKSSAFLRIPELLNDKIEIDKICIKNSEDDNKYDCEEDDKGENLIRLDGSLNEIEDANGYKVQTIAFSANSKINITFPENLIIESVTVSRVGFQKVEEKKYAFDIDATPEFSKSISSFDDLFSIENLLIQNIRFDFDLGVDIPFPNPNFSEIKINFPKINFNGEGLLGSFPLTFNTFNVFKIVNRKIDFDFITLNGFNFNLPNGEVNLFSFIFDMDLGTLGDLSGLKGLKAKLLLGWTPKGGFVVGMKMEGSINGKVNINLFGALKLQSKVALCSYTAKNDQGKDVNSFLILLQESKITIFGKEFPKEGVLNGVIFASPFGDNKSNKTAWLLNKVVADNLIFSAGQRVKAAGDATSVIDALKAVKDSLKINDFDCRSRDEITKIHSPGNNWLVASEKILPDSWPLDLKFIFNDPNLYGLFIGFKGEALKGFSIDILYNKLSNNVGVYSAEIQLPDELRNHNLGGADIILPNFGVEIFTNGDWMVDIGFPKKSDDWSRSGFIQLNTAPPFVGWFGFYLRQSKLPQNTLFNGILDNEDVNIIQAGFAMRVGLGAYLDEGILFIGASITVYGIMEGAFAFEKKDTGLNKLLPNHFALRGRLGAIAEVVGYVDFKVTKAAVRMSLQTEFGFLFIYLGKDIPNTKFKKGIQPVKVYIIGTVNVSVRVTLFCVRFFRKKWCLKVHFSFRAQIRFEYIIGGSGNSNKIAFQKQMLQLSQKSLDGTGKTIINIDSIGDIPMVFIPGFTRSKEEGDNLYMVANFYIPFFGVKVNNGELVPSVKNIFKDKIVAPFFTDLLRNLPKEHHNYNHIRKILLDVKDNEYDIHIPNYRPNFIKGVNSNSDDELTEILKTHFEFDKAEGKEEANTFIRNQECNSGDPEKCPYRAITAPISSKVKIDGKENNGDGFTISVENLTNVGKPILFEIEDIEISEEHKVHIDNFFNSYKTQFLERKGESNKLDDPKFDIRENVIIPEYFKLIALITLEKAHNEFNKLQKDGNTYNPTVSVDDSGNLVLTDERNETPSDERVKTFEINGHINDLIGQINYFYNSGLRIPENETAEKTVSILEFLDQVKPLSGGFDDDLDTKILFKFKEEESNDSKEIDFTEEIFGEGENGKESIKDTRKYATSLVESKFDPSEDFGVIEYEEPYKLEPVTLGISNDFTKINDKTRFYEIPKKLFAQGRNNESKFEFKLVAANYQAESKPDKAENLGKDSIFSENLYTNKCLNIEIKVRKSKVEKGNQVFELINVKAEDLTLMNLLKNDPKTSIDSIIIYEKNDPDFVQLEPSTLVKTNLSIRTSPPVFDLESKKKKKSIESIPTFIARTDDADKSEFMRLLWEGLTTNNGGYYLVVDKKLNLQVPEILTEEAIGTESTVVVSFGTSNSMTEIPYYFNTLKISDNGGLFEKLDENEVYLYLNDLIQDKKNVKEYHVTMAPHTFGFKVARTLPNPVSEKADPTSQYLPLEFEIKQVNPSETVLSLDKVLPIMPQNPKVNGKDDEKSLLYSHVSPLVDFVDKNKNGGRPDKHRYSAVGEEFTLSIGVRDIYGMRWSAESIKTLSHTQKYFDKLIPVDSWPFIKFSYWMNDLNKWEVTGNFHILEILDLAGIPRNEDNTYQYNYEDSITNEEHVKNFIETLNGLIAEVDTIYDQIRDEILIEITDFEGDQITLKTEIETLVCKVKSCLENMKKFPDKIVLPKMDKGTHTSSFICKTEFFKENNDQLYKELDFVISLKRTKDIIDPKKGLDKPEIWDYASVKSTSSKIAIGVAQTKPKKEENQKPDSDIKKLNEKLKKVTSYNVSLALSVNKNLERVLFLVNEEKLKALDLSSPITVKSYFGIKPISNKLYDGNVDLDIGLRVILDKIDELLDGKHLSTVDFSTKKDLINDLIQAKKDLVSKKLCPQIDWVFEQSSIADTKSSETFKELILDKLSNFYAYDGVISTQVNKILPDNHRLSISLDSHDGYELFSSKISSDDKWNIFFDKLEKADTSNKKEKDELNFKIIPSITHLEKDIEKNDSNEIQTSQWLHLVDPIKLRKDYEVKNFPDIYREYPPVPTQLTHEVTQNNTASTLNHKWELLENMLPNVGEWNYKLNFNGEYKEGDRLEFLILLQTGIKKANLYAGLTFEGFIAKWKPIIVGNRDFNTIEFINNLKEALNNQTESFSVESKEDNTFAKDDEVSFIFKLEGDLWTLKLLESSPNVNKYVESLTEVDKKLTLKLEGNNIFESNKVKNITAKVRAIRNGDTKNPKFKYETGFVSPASPASVFLEYNQPLYIEDEDFQKLVFDPLNACALPYKLTSKYIIPLDKEKPEDAKYMTEISSKLTQKSGGKYYLEISDKDDFDGFDENNGFQAYSLSIYDNKGLTVLKADTIYKRKKSN